MQTEHIWNQVKTNLKDRNPNNHFLHTWIESAQILNNEIEEEKDSPPFCFEILVPSELHKHWISENLVDLISSEISHLYSKKFSIKLQVTPKLQKKHSTPKSLSLQTPFSSLFKRQILLFFSLLSPIYKAKNLVLLLL